MELKKILIAIISVQIIVVTYLLWSIAGVSHFGMFSLVGQNISTAGRPDFTPFYQPSNDPILHAELIPNHFQYFEGFAVKLNRTIIQINSDGFRDREFSVEKPNNTVRIIVLGDSFTFGWGINNSDTYPKVLEKKLNNELNASFHFEVLNFGVSGYNTLEEVRFFKLKGLKYKPDIVIVGYVAGDLENNTKIKTDEWSKEIDDDISKNYNFLSEIDKQILKGELSSHKLREDMATNFQLYLKENVLTPLDDLGNMSEKEGFKVVIVFLTDVSEKEQIKEIAKKHNFSIVDASQDIGNYSPASVTLSNYDTHYNEFGNKLIADSIFTNVFNSCGLKHILPT
jgi:hypothetical protein